MSPHGVIEESAPAWGRHSPAPEDNRSLAELAAAVMGAAQLDQSQGAETIEGHQLPLEERLMEPAVTGVVAPAGGHEADEPRRKRSGVLLATLGAVALLLFAGGAAFLGIGTPGGNSGGDQPGQDSVAAVPPGSVPPGQDSGASSSGGGSAQALVTQATPTPAPAAPETTPAPAQTAAPAPPPTVVPTP